MNVISQQNEIENSKLFDFWIGNWEVSWNESNGITGRGVNKIERILDGKAIQENFVTLEGNAKGFKGTSISLYQPKRDRWKQVWVDNQGAYYDFHDFKEGNIRYFQTQILKRNENGYIFRMAFKDIKDNSFIWDWETSNDRGKTWKLNWRINYKRILAD